MKVTWLGHATVAIEMAGTLLVTDPVLRARVAHLRRHAPQPPALEGVEAVLLSHLHHDHMDLPSLRALGVRVVGPRGASRVLRRSRLPVEELRPGDTTQVGQTRVTAVPAVHDGRRLPLTARNDEGSIGFVVEDGPRRVYFAGDTELFDGMSDLPALDLALVPIWGWGPGLGPGHMNPEQAADSLALLDPAVAVPIHWGTFLPLGSLRRHGHLLRTPVEPFRRRAAKVAPQVHVEVLEPGGSFEL